MTLGEKTFTFKVSSLKFFPYFVLLFLRSLKIVFFFFLTVVAYGVVLITAV